MDGVTIRLPYLNPMETAIGAGDQPQQSDQREPQPPSKAVEKLNQAVQQQLNLDSIKARAISLFKAISRILQDFHAMPSNALPKWQDVHGQFSMVNLELFNIVEDIKKTSRAFVIHPKNVNAENAAVLPVMLSSKLLPEMEADDCFKREQLLLGMQDFPVSWQIDKLKARIDMIAAACESAEKVLAETRKAYGLDTRHRMITPATMDKTFLDKFQGQEKLLRTAVNHGDGLRLPAGQKKFCTTALPSHLVDVLSVEVDQTQTFPNTPGMYTKSTPISGNISNNATPLQGSGAQLIGGLTPSPSQGAQSTLPLDNTSPLPYGNSPRSGINMANAPSPQQQTNQQHLTPQQQRMKLMQLTPQQIIAQQQFRQSPMSVVGQNRLSQLNDLQAQAQQKFQAQMQFSQPLANQQLQGRQLPTGHIQHGIGQSQLSQGAQLNHHMSQFSSPANSALFSAAQSIPNTSMIPNMSATMLSQPYMSRMQFALPGNAQRIHASQILNDQAFNMGAANTGSVIPFQQQQLQHHSPGSFGNLPQNNQNLQQPNMVSLQNIQQNRPSFQQQQRQQNQQ